MREFVVAKSSKIAVKQSKTVALKVPPSRVVYLLGKGTSRLLNARVNREEIHLLVNGPAMLYGAGRILVSLDFIEGATFHSWTRLARSLTCTSYCGHNGKTMIPITVETSRIGTCLLFSMGPMSMYQSLVVLRPKKKNLTMRDALDNAFGHPKRSYSAIIIPEAATGHEEHDASIFEPAANSDHKQHNHH